MSEQKSHFAFTSYQVDIPGGLATFHYELAHEGTVHEFTEILTFTPPSNYQIPEKNDLVLESLLNGLHILLGISYWKAACPSDIRVNNQQLTQKQATFWNTVYTKGLGEFFYKNSIDFRNLVHFPHGENISPELPRKQFSNRALVLHGSGKDSIVTAELLKKSGKEISLFCLNAKPIHRKTADLIGLPFIESKRTIDPKLLALNKKPNIYNGHVPITAIVSYIGLFLAYLYDFRYVITSNEESANYGNVQYHGSVINHQWSKTFEFETLFKNYIQGYISQDLIYFSLLRPLTEFAIVRLFVRYPQYFTLFSSCNKNFKLSETSESTIWCGECPKCAFVFLLLSACLPKEQTVSIFHKNLFADERLLPTYKELLALEGIKPFECVGTPEESLAAFEEVQKKGEYVNDVMLQSLSPAVDRMLKEKTLSIEKVFVLSSTHSIPDEFVNVVSTI